MTKENQKILYDHFVKVSKERHDTVGKNCARYAADILKSYPEFEEVAEEVKEVKSKGKK